MFEHINSEQILKTLLKKGGDYADIFFEHNQQTSITCEDKKMESIVSGINRGAGLRLISNLHTAYGATNKFDSLSNLGESLAGTLQAKDFSGDIHLSTINPKLSFPVLQTPALIPTNQKVAMLENLNKQAWAMDKKIVQVRIRYGDGLRHTEIATSEGHYAVSPRTLLVLSITITMSDGDHFFTGYESTGGHGGFELLTEQALNQTLQKAVFRAQLNLKAKRAKAGTMPVVISSQAGGTLVHEAVGHGLEADLACQGMSVYGDKKGQVVASPKITVVDDPTLPQKRGSYLFDDEGVPSQKAVLIENGVLKNYMFDRLTAMKMDCASNGHGRRESFEYRPVVRMANTLILPGQDNPDEIIASVNDGLFVKMMGGGQVNTINGDFMFEVTEGYRIENGKIGEPVRGATLTGNGPEVLKIIDKVGNDLGFSIGTCGKDGQNAPVSDAMPTIRIPEMVVGGVVE